MSMLWIWALSTGALDSWGSLTPMMSAVEGGLPPGSAFLGPFHMVVLHLPIGLFSFTALLELVAWFRPFEGLRRVLATSLGLGVVTAILTSILGLYRSFGGDYSAEILALHRNTGLALTVVAALTLVLHSAVLRVGNLWLGWYRASLGLTLILLLIASHHGGSLTHGQGFLTQNAPPVIRGWMARWGAQEPRSKPSEPVVTGAVEVAKVFEAKCVSCHGPDKQKGKFRVDQRESLLKGGQSGEAAVVPGDPGRSRLMRLVLLPASHDDVMPPSGKVPLSESEILSLLRWIQLGAP